MRPIVLLLMLLATAPAAGCTARSAHPAEASWARVPAVGERGAGGERPGADQEELARYAAREEKAAGLEKFEGGRGDTTTIIIVLLLVIIIVILV